MRNAISLGGDTDTMACMAAGIAEAYYHRDSAIAPELLLEMNRRLPEEMKTIIADF